MDIGSIFLILALLIPVVLYISRPLMERTSPKVSRAGQDISTLLAERDQVIATLQELEIDYNLGKIPSENYPTQRTVLLQHGADILRKIDSFQLSPNPATSEAAVSMRHPSPDTGHNSVKKNGPAVSPVPDDELEQLIANRRRTMQGKAGGFCPKCGRPVQVSDRFCPKCGATLS
jgi:hypothetical protein